MLDASGIIHIRDDLFLVAEDEKDVLRYFRLNVETGSFSATGNRIDFGQQESDFESLAFDPIRQRYYCIGSHGQTYSKRLISFQIGQGDEIASFEIDFNAKHFIDDDIDIEGLSVWNNCLFIGYRRPTRNNSALAVLFDPACAGQVLTSFDLRGRSFRDIVRINDENYLILAGPVRGRDYEKMPPLLYWWNGEIFCPRLVMCNVNLAGFRAEGIAVRLHETGALDILVGSDESKIENATHFRMLHARVNDISELLNNSKLAAAELTVNYSET